MIEWVLFFVTLAVLLGAAAYDMVMTRRGIATGIYDEAHTFLVGPKPTLEALLLREALYSGSLTGVTVAGLNFSTELFTMGLAGMIMFAAMHIRGGWNWHKLFAAAKTSK